MLASFQTRPTNSHNFCIIQNIDLFRQSARRSPRGLRGFPDHSQPCGCAPANRGEKGWCRGTAEGTQHKGQGADPSAAHAGNNNNNNLFRKNN